tara:strand:- start:527 stop:1393 length:867 start_codon:yes stop_codon:yes gene_type:complete
MVEITPLVSVIIPCYNEGKFLLEAVNSVEKQSYKNFEIIIVKDYSDHTETLKVCQLLKSQNRAEVLYLKTHSWTATARNKGIESSNGEIIFTLDGDDTIASDFLEKTVSVLIQKVDIGFVYTDMYRFNSKIKYMHKKSSFEVGKVVAEGYPSSAIVFWKRYFDLTTGYYEKLKGQEDYEFLIQLCGLEVNGYHLSEPLYYYRLKSSNYSKHSYSKEKYGLESKLLILEKNHRVFEKHSIEVIRNLLSLNDSLWRYQYENSKAFYHIKWLLSYFYLLLKNKFFFKKIKL